MNWNYFKTHGEAPSRAFEAFCGVLFERWCHREYGANIEHIYYVNGAGGDGGVEAYAKLKNGEIVGLQTIWRPPFRLEFGQRSGDSGQC